MGLEIKIILLPLLEEKFSQKLLFTKPYRKQLNIPVKGTMWQQPVVTIKYSKQERLFPLADGK